MTSIIVGAIFKSENMLNDFLARFCFHFQSHKNLKLFILKDPYFNSNELSFSSGMDSLAQPDIQRLLHENSFELAFKQVIDIDAVLSEITGCTACLIYDVDFYKKSYIALKKVAKKFYYCDPLKTRQEGSNFIQASLDLLPKKEKDNNETSSLSKFLKLKESLRLQEFEKATIFATGPSVNEFREFNYAKSINIYCNSTILDDELLKSAPPNILTFADPIFHFGVSEYANSFRASCKEFLNVYIDCTIIIPIKYYALALCLFPGYKERIIGLPFTKDRPVNFEITKERFYTYTTSNILTLSLLPVATTFAKSIRLIGCDGRKVSDDSYFWNHGSSVQINDKMKAIQKAHPGFFDINYNEYYFEHCHNLSRMLFIAEDHGWSFSHLGPSFIPALKSRSTVFEDNQVLKSDKDPQPQAFVIIEPDGLKIGDGHYEIWHRSLEKVTNDQGFPTFILHNKKSSLYQNDSSFPVFNRHSWSMLPCEKEDLHEALSASDSYIIFTNNLQEAFANTNAFSDYKIIHLYMYYGSILHLKALLDFKKSYEANHDCTVYISLTLSYEAIRFDHEKNYFWGHKFGHFKSILLEAQYFSPNVKVFAMTDRFAKFIFRNYDVLLPTLTHPILEEGITCPVNHSFSHSKVPEILLLGRYTIGKFPSDYFKIISQILDSSNFSIKIRGSSSHSDALNHLSHKYQDRIIRLPEELSSIEYNNSFQSADIVLIPYLPDNFLMRSSGLLVDAIMNEKPIVCFGQSSISDTVLDKSIGIYCNLMNSSSIINATKTILNNYSMYKKSIRTYKNFLNQTSTFNAQFQSCISDKVRFSSNVMSV